MPKPLLTDEVIAQARREAQSGGEDEVKLVLKAKKFDKSRRLAHARRGGFYSKLNLLLTLVVVLLIALIYAMFKL